MPATKHQQDVLRTDDKAPQGQNMEATGAGGGAMPATKHQQDVLKQPELRRQDQSINPIWLMPGPDRTGRRGCSHYLTSLVMARRPGLGQSTA